jgi:hypothetical protein
MRKSILILAIVTFLPFTVPAQRYLGIATGNYMPTQSMYINPAFLANGTRRLVIDIASVNFGVDNDVARLNSGKTIRRFFNGDSVAIGDVFSFGSKDRFNMLAPYGEVRGPGVMLRVAPNHTLALSTRVRAINQFHNFSQKFYRSITDADYREEGNDYVIQSQSFNWSAQLWSEIGLSYATTLLQADGHKLSAGITLRYLGGIGYLNMKANNVDLHYYAANDSLRVSNTDVQFSSNLITGEDQLSHGISASDVFGGFFGKKGGHGLGADIGFVYEYSAPDEKADGYTFRASLAVTDIGSIRYKNDNRIAYLRGDGYLRANELSDNINNFQDFRAYAESHGLSVDTASGATKMHLPTALTIGADYHVLRDFFINVLIIGNLTGRNSPGNSYYGQFSVTPRYEKKLWGVGLPITYDALSKKMKLGIGARVSGFFIGSDDMLAFLGNSQYGINFYFGGCVPLK